ncbi:hypothetical protein VTN49DRAFT_1167 [Thermomyces lanuginosus]|uniref:uncharacterized protein n=1 Tax=Thermomyces lanuginosus TaxID=5541 RepID=UPI003743E860
MDFSFDIPDSTDWLDTPLARVAPLESALRCQVCKDFFDNPVITSCSHTFCSLCIRRCLSSEGKCPTCRSTDQEVRLRRNWAVQELVDTFKEARADILALARAHKPVDKSGDAQQSHGRDDAAGEPAAKRRRVDDTSDQVASFSVQSEPPATAPQSRAPDSSVPPALEAVESGSPGHVGSSDVHQASPSRASPSVNSSTEPSDDIVACPICNRKMKNEAVFGHLDSCPGPSRSPTENSTPTPTPTPVSLNRGRPPKYSQRTPFGPRQSVSSDNNNSKPPERLPALNYALLKDNALRKKLRELGIPHWGPRQLLQRRHTEWMNLWNANCDARVPKSHAELLRDLDTWERTQGGLAANSGGSAASGGSSIMAKDFDAKACLHERVVNRDDQGGDYANYHVVGTYPDRDSAPNANNHAVGANAGRQPVAGTDGFPASVDADDHAAGVDTDYFVITVNTDFCDPYTRTDGSDPSADTHDHASSSNTERDPSSYADGHAAVANAFYPTGADVHDYASGADAYGHATTPDVYYNTSSTDIDAQVIGAYATDSDSSANSGPSPGAYTDASTGGNDRDNCPHQ